MTVARSPFDYLYDKESTNYSRRALEDLILQATSSPDVADVTILATHWALG